MADRRGLRRAPSHGIHVWIGVVSQRLRCRLSRARYPPAGLERPMHRNEFRYSRKATLLCLFFSVALSAISLIAFEHPVGAIRAPVWLPVLFIFSAVAFAWLIIRPRRLVLDDQGFSIAGGFAWRPTSFRWQDVSEFYLRRLGRGSEAIGFRLKATPRDQTRFADSPLPPPGEVYLPQGWDQPPEIMVQELNRLRARAVHQLH